MELAEYRVKQEAKREAERDEKFKAQRKNVQNADKVEQSSKYFTSLEEYDKWEAEQDAENEKIEAQNDAEHEKRMAELKAEHGK